MPTAGRIKEDGSESDFYLYQDGMNYNNKLTKAALTVLYWYPKIRKD
jgi:hypothetical protein